LTVEFRVLLADLADDLRHAKNRDDGLSQWLNELTIRKHANFVTVALANKTARIAWAIVHNNMGYDPILAASNQNV